MNRYVYETACETLIPKRSPSTDEEQQAFSASAVICQRVKAEGDAAALDYTATFDGCRPSAWCLLPSEFDRAYQNASEDLLSALRTMAQRIKDFHSPQFQTGYLVADAAVPLGQLIRPLEKVMVYVPGGTAIYLSTLLMNVIPAQIAGVDTIYVASPPRPDGTIDDSLLAACKLLGLNNLYTIGGAQAIAAFAYGTETIPRVDKIVGPGNAYVAAAKKWVFGDVGIDMLAGPSEVLIIADDTANPSWVAADALAQLEHDQAAKAIILSPSIDQLDRIADALDQQRLTSYRQKQIEASLTQHCHLVLTQDLSEAARFSNAYAPEHLGLSVADPEALLPKIRHAGAVFLGHYSPEAVGDYSAGSNHVLPTLGSARFQSPLGVYDFQRRMNVVQYNQASLSADLSLIKTIATQEGLYAHERAATIRF